jgi:hypothetical protein
LDLDRPLAAYLPDPFLPDEPRVKDLFNVMVPFALTVPGVDGVALNRRENALAEHALCVVYPASTLGFFRPTA